MCNDRSKSRQAALFAMVLALFMTPLILAGEKAKETGTQAAPLAVEQPAQPAADPQPEGQAVAPVEDATAVAGELPDGEIDPSAEPQTELKTKTKSNQSND